MSANGYLTSAELTSIGNGLFLANAPAAAWALTRADALRAGVNVQATAIASAYRPWAMQVDMRKNPAKYGINPNLGGLPGLPSRHGLGNCRDVPFGAPNNWMIAHGHERGWSRPAATMAINDLNHWEFTPGTATAGGGSTPIAAGTEDEMKIIYNATSGEASIVGGSNGCLVLGKADALGEQLTALEQVYGSRVTLTDTYYNLNKSWATKTALVVPASSGGAGGGSTDLTPVLQAIAALDTQSDTYQAQLLAAIANVDEATLATFGLKRA